MLEKLYEKDTQYAYNYLLELEELTDISNELYPYFDEFIKMLASDITYIRVRGFRMIASLAKWDIDDKIKKNINLILNILNEPKPTALRQYLKALEKVLNHKNLNVPIKEALDRIDISKYRETVGHLIKKDIENLRSNYELY